MATRLDTILLLVALILPYSTSLQRFNCINLKQRRKNQMRTRRRSPPCRRSSAKIW